MTILEAFAMLINQGVWVVVSVTEENKAFGFLKVKGGTESLYKPETLKGLQCR